MKVHRYSEQQRRQWVYEMQHKLKSVKQICREAIISRATLYNWLKELATGAEDNKVQGEQGDAAAWQPLDKHKMLIAALSKIDPDKTVSNKLVSELVKRYTLTAAQACAIAGVDPSAYNYKPRKPEVEDRLVYDELLRLIAADTARSLDDCTAILQQTHPGWTGKQIKRIYRQGRLYLKRTRARNTKLLAKAGITAGIAITPAHKGTCWQVGAIAAISADNRPFHLLYIIDYNDGTPLHVVVPEGNLTAAGLVKFLSLAAKENGAPKKMRVVAQPPFNSREVARWIWDNKVALYNLSLAKPENQLAIGHLEDSIRQQLLTDATTVEKITEKAETWIAGFAANGVTANEMQLLINEEL